MNSLRDPRFFEELLLLSASLLASVILATFAASALGTPLLLIPAMIIGAAATSVVFTKRRKLPSFYVNFLFIPGMTLLIIGLALNPPGSP